MVGWSVLLILGTFVASCARPVQPEVSVKDLVFLTRGGCANTTTMRASLDEALGALALPTDYQVLNLDTLQATDARIGYPTPTVLYRDRDLLGMSVPVAPFPEPT